MNIPLSKVFEGVMDKLRSDEKYKPSEWSKFSVPYMSYFIYEKSIRLCEMILETEGAKDTLDLVKNMEFDVIIQDVTVMQCMYGIWEVSVTNIYFFVNNNLRMNRMIFCILEF